LNEYYVVKNNAITKVKLSKDDAKKILGDKWSEIEKYASENKISFKTEAGWREILSKMQ